jgi:putative transposase
MAIPTRATSHGTFFISTQTYNRRRLFQVPANAELLIDTLQHYRREGHYKLHAFVIMPDHIHLILTPQEITLERSIQLIKGGFSHRLGSKLPVWQRGFTDRRLRDADDFRTHITYLHHNPVRAHLCQLPQDYPYSSAWRIPTPAPEGEAL